MGFLAHKFVACMVMFAVLVAGVNCVCAAQPSMAERHHMVAHECGTNCAACCAEQNRSERPARQDAAQCACEGQGLYTSTSSPTPDLKPAAPSFDMFLAALPVDGGLVAAMMPVFRPQQLRDSAFAAPTTTLLRLHCALTV